jgi:hypothetical protein
MRYLRLHLEERESAGEKLTDETWLFRTTQVYVDGVRTRISYADPHVMPIEGGALNDVVVDAAEKIGIQQYVKSARGRKHAKVHAHCGRNYFKSQMRKSGVDIELRDFMMGHLPDFEGAYDKYAETEIVRAMEQARGLLAITPEPADEVEKRKQTILDSARLFMDGDKMEALRELLLQAKSTVEVEAALEKFNGKGRLRVVGRE